MQAKTLLRHGAGLMALAILAFGAGPLGAEKNGEPGKHLDQWDKGRLGGQGKLDTWSGRKTQLFPGKTVGGGKGGITLDNAHRGGGAAGGRRRRTGARCWEKAITATSC